METFLNLKCIFEALGNFLERPQRFEKSLTPNRARAKKRSRSRGVAKVQNSNATKGEKQKKVIPMEGRDAVFDFLNTSRDLDLRFPTCR